MAFHNQLVVPFSNLIYSQSIFRYSSCDSSFNGTAEKCFEKSISEVKIDLSGRKSGFDGG
jgi:hypothetical protein